MNRFKWFALAAFLLMVPLANWLIEEYGTVPVGFGLQAPAAVYAAGLALLLRDLVQRAFGKTVAAAVILAGAALSYLVAPDFALASAVAFLAAEFVDLVVYSTLEPRSFAAAVLVSNVVGLLVDSYLFLQIAFGNLDFFWGQVVGKAWMGLGVGLLLILTVRRLEPATA